MRGIDYNQVNHRAAPARLPQGAEQRPAGAEGGRRVQPELQRRTSPGSQPLPFFAAARQRRLTNGTVLSNIQTGQVGELANFYQTSTDQRDREFLSTTRTFWGANVLTNYSNSAL